MSREGGAFLDLEIIAARLMHRMQILGTSFKNKGWPRRQPDHSGGHRHHWLPKGRRLCPHWRHFARAHLALGEPETATSPATVAALKAGRLPGSQHGAGERARCATEAS